MDDRNSDKPLPVTPDAYDVPAETAEILATMARRIATIERERKRIRPEDWATLFRQIRTLAQQLATHPFIRGDLEAEMRVDRMLMAADLEEFDRRVDELGDYVEGKLAFNAALAAEEAGTAPAEVPRLRASAPSALGVSRLVSAQGPSGSDFDLGGDTTGNDGGAPAPRRRGVLRL